MSCETARVRDPYAVLAERLEDGAEVTRRWSLSGGVSASVEGLELALPDGGARRVVVRRHGTADWKPTHADVTATEFALLRALDALGMCVPSPILLDTSSGLLGSPYLVTSFVEGSAEVEESRQPEALRQMAEVLARLHALDVERVAPPALARLDDAYTCALRWLGEKTPATESLRAALAEGARGAERNTSTLVHNDFGPRNILWKDHAIAAIIDWEDAAVGDPLADLAGCRMELLWRWGAEAMESFTEHYLSLTGVDAFDLCAWEICCAAAAAAFMGSWGLDPSIEGRMRDQAGAVMARASKQIVARAG